MKPICVPCQRFFKIEKSGFYFLEGMPTENGALPGGIDKEKWKPYKLWAGDKWKCPGCGAEIISGVGFNRIAEHYEEDFQTRIEQMNATQFQVNDC